MVVVKQSNTKRRLEKKRLEAVKVNLPKSNVENETCECENIYLIGKCIFYLGYFNTRLVGW